MSGIAPPGQEGRIERSERFREATLTRETGRLFKILNHRPVSQAKVATHLLLTLLKYEDLTCPGCRATIAGDYEP